MMTALGGRGVLAAELDPHAARVYKKNWGLDPVGDVRDVAARASEVPDHHVLTAGFPCQPFSKGGLQRGMSELRGQLVHEIFKILETKRPPVVFLENVRNLAGPRQLPVYESIITGLRRIGYRVSTKPAVLSPHLLPPRLGGSPQIRERLYILGTFVGPDRAERESEGLEPIVTNHPVEQWNPNDWDLARDLLLPPHKISDRARYEIQSDDPERRWFEVWQAFLDMVRPAKLPGFPLWSMYWGPHATVSPEAPQWKKNLERKNIVFYYDNKRSIDRWLRKYGDELRTFPQSRQKLEWQAQTHIRRIDQCLIHLRPSGIRLKRATYTPALVAMAQTPVYGPEMRRLVPREAARLQGFPDWFDFDNTPPALVYKQMGNAIHIGAAYYVLRRHVLQDAVDIKLAGGEGLVRAVQDAPAAPKVVPPSISQDNFEGLETEKDAVAS